MGTSIGAIGSGVGAMGSGVGANGSGVGTVGAGVGTVRVAGENRGAAVANVTRDVAPGNAAAAVGMSHESSQVMMVRGDTCAGHQ